MSIDVYPRRIDTLHAREGSSQLTVVGGFGLGVSFFVDRAPAAGETVGGARLLQTPGGKGSNQAVGAARLGAPVRLLTAIADDPAGRLGRELWAAEGVDASGVAELDGTTMVGAIITDSTGENRIVVADGVLATYAPNHLDPAHFAAGVCLVSTEIATPAAAQALTLGRAAGAITVLNPAPVPDPAAIDWRCVDVLTPNRGEAAHLLGRPVEEGLIPDAARALRDRYGVSVVMTLGAQGALVAHADGGLDLVASPSVDLVVDTTGAGDAFNAGLATGLLRGLDFVSAARLGAFCGSQAVRVAGVIPALPRLSDVIAALLRCGQVDLAATLQASRTSPGAS